MLNRKQLWVRLRAVALRLRFLLWRYLRAPISGWLDRRYQAKHLREFGWPIRMGWGPYSYEGENVWHESCPDGHAWERIDWPYGRHIRRGHRPDRVTRCRTCGAPRCDTYHSFPDNPWPDNDNARQYLRCTLERHHREAHDFLTGARVEVGA